MFIIIIIIIIIIIVVATSRTWFQHNDIIFQIARQHFPFHPMEHLVHKAWKAHKSLHLHVKSMFFLIGMACSHFLSHCLWFKYIWTCMTCQPSILACFRFSNVFNVFQCCGFNLRKFKKEYSWWGLHFSLWLPLSPLYQQKRSLSNRAFITLLSHMGYHSIFSQLNSQDPSQKEHEDQIPTFQDHL